MFDANDFFSNRQGLAKPENVQNQFGGNLGGPVKKNKIFAFFDFEGTTIRKGGAVYMDVVIHNKEGFGGQVTITAEGLPKGLHIAPTTINNDTRGVLVLWADKDAPEWVGPIKLTTTGKSGDTTITREVRPYSRVWNSTDLNSSRPTRELMVAISSENTPFSITPAVEKIEVPFLRKDLDAEKARLRDLAQIVGGMDVVRRMWQAAGIDANSAAGVQ